MRTAVVVVALLFSTPALTAPVTVASKAFTESRVLGEMLALLLEHEGLEVERKLNLGGTAIVFNALKAGEVDLYVEYTGTAAAVLLETAREKMTPLEVYARVQQQARTLHDLEWWSPLGFNNTYAITMLRARADKLDITQVSDLKAHPDLKFGVTHEFLQRDDGWPGMSAVYGLKDHNVRGLDHGLAFEALKSGAVDLVDAFSTDGKLADKALLVLEDDRGYFPPYDASALIRAETAKDPRVRRALDKLSFRIDDEKMRALNLAAEQGGGRYRAVAQAFLAKAGLLGAAPVVVVEPIQEKKSVVAFAIEKRADLLRLVAEHLTLTLLAVLLAVLIAVPPGHRAHAARALATAHPRRRGHLADDPLAGAPGIFDPDPDLWPRHTHRGLRALPLRAAADLAQHRDRHPRGRR